MLLYSSGWFLVHCSSLGKVLDVFFRKLLWCFCYKCKWLQRFFWVFFNILYCYVVAMALLCDGKQFWVHF